MGKTIFLRRNGRYLVAQVAIRDFTLTVTGFLRIEEFSGDVIWQTERSGAVSFSGREAQALAAKLNGSFEGIFDEDSAPIHIGSTIGASRIKSARSIRW